MTLISAQQLDIKTTNMPLEIVLSWPSALSGGVAGPSTSPPVSFCGVTTAEHFKLSTPTTRPSPVNSSGASVSDEGMVIEEDGQGSTSTPTPTPTSTITTQSPTSSDGNSEGDFDCKDDANGETTISYEEMELDDNPLPSIEEYKPCRPIPAKNRLETISDKAIFGTLNYDIWFIFIPHHEIPVIEGNVRGVYSLASGFEMAAFSFDVTGWFLLFGEDKRQPGSVLRGFSGRSGRDGSLVWS